MVVVLIFGDKSIYKEGGCSNGYVPNSPYILCLIAGDEYIYKERGGGCSNVYVPNSPDIFSLVAVDESIYKEGGGGEMLKWLRSKLTRCI